MRRVIASVVAVALLLLTSAPPAHAGKSTDIALGLASFAVFNQVVAPLLRPRHAEAAYHRREVVYTTVVHPPAVVHYHPVVPAPPPPTPTVIQYPHGRYELQLHGSQYVWVWIPNVPPPPPAPPAPAP
ncbi:MAG TPA: hypothetical protein VNO23_01465 [Candidatus Binatia bacterium]|nr:hypothetical protein [Candidatus Binatia bacterium]